MLGAALVGQDDPHAGVQEGQLAQAMFQRGEVELGLGEGAGGGQEGHFRAVLALVGLAHDLQVAFRLAVPEAHVVFLAVAPDAQVEMLRQGVHHRRADAVQAARDLVGILVELPAGMELRQDHVGGRDALFLVDVGRHAAAVVADRRPSRRRAGSRRPCRNSRPAPRRSRCPRSRRPCGAGRCRRRCRRCTCPAACGRPRGRAAP